MLDKGLGSVAAAFQAAELLHRAVPLVDVLHVLAHVAIAGLVLALEHALDVDPVCGVEHLALGARHRLEVEQLEAAVQTSPGIHHQDTATGVVAVSVKGPVGHDDVGVLAVDEFAHLLVALQVDLGVAVDLAHEDVARAGHLAGILALDHADGGSLVMAHAGNACLAAGEIDAHHLVARLGEQAHRAAAAGLGVIGVGSDGQHLEAALARRVILVTILLGVGAHGQPQHRDSHGGRPCLLDHFSSVHDGCDFSLLPQIYTISPNYSMLTNRFLSVFVKM